MCESYAALLSAEEPAPDDFESEDEAEDDEDGDDDGVDVDGFDGDGELLDEEPRLSLR